MFPVLNGDCFAPDDDLFLGLLVKGGTSQVSLVARLSCTEDAACQDGYRRLSLGFASLFRGLSTTCWHQGGPKP